MKVNKEEVDKIAKGVVSMAFITLIISIISIIFTVMLYYNKSNGVKPYFIGALISTILTIILLHPILGIIAPILWIIFKIKSRKNI